MKFEERHPKLYEIGRYFFGFIATAIAMAAAILLWAVVS